MYIKLLNDIPTKNSAYSSQIKLDMNTPQKLEYISALFSVSWQTHVTSLMSVWTFLRGTAAEDVQTVTAAMLHQEWALSTRRSTSRSVKKSTSVAKELTHVIRTQTVLTHW